MTRSVLLILILAYCGTAQAAPIQMRVPAPNTQKFKSLQHQPTARDKADAVPPPFQPHFVSQRSDKAYLREGPTFAHKVLWVYRHKGYPFLVTASFDIWRRVRDVDGTVGWMSAQMLSDSRTALVTGYDRAPIHESVDPASKVVGLADPGAILGLKGCVKDSCRGSAAGIEGWIAKSRIWGVGKIEVFR